MGINWIGERISDETRLAVQAASDGKRIVSERLLTSALFRWRFSGAPADRFDIVPQDLRTVDPSFAAELYQGHFGFGGALLVVGDQSPFSAIAPSKEWERELHGFGWLRHVGGSDDGASREFACSLLVDWVKRCDSMQGVAWETSVTARRIISWLAHAPVVLEEADDSDFDVVMRSVGRQLRYLAASYGNAENGEPRLTTLLALVLAGLCLEDRQSLTARFLKPFCLELELQISQDGGHVSRNPWSTANLLFDLLPVRQCFLARHEDVPEALSLAIDRMLPMIKFMRLGDGHLGRFNGTGASQPDALSALMSYDATELGLSGQARDTGYTRMVAGRSVVLVDSGKPPELTFSEQAHAGCLSFEMSSGDCPIFVNCGAPGSVHREWSLHGRSSAAHTTATVENASSSRLLRGSVRDEDMCKSFLSGPTEVSSDLRETQKGRYFVGSHNGYCDRFGVVHVRKMMLREGGRKLDGEDNLYLEPDHGGGAKQAGRTYALHFHVHPDVEVTWPNKDEPVLLALPSGEQWSFFAFGTAISLEESMFLSDVRGPRQALQLIIRGAFLDEVQVRWSVAMSSEEKS